MATIERPRTSVNHVYMIANENIYSFLGQHIALMMIICTLDELNDSLLVLVSFYGYLSIFAACLEVVGMWWCFYKSNPNWRYVEVIELKRGA